ncbi:hypothetical protein, partial [Listeria monocytogenes]|uniref:hypothetical protein n=1 Tax=Listeria monocytogenes TaxID=1639 RepID=UPI001C0F35E8
YLSQVHLAITTGRLKKYENSRKPLESHEFQRLLLIFFLTRIRQKRKFIITGCLNQKNCNRMMAHPITV